MIRRKNPPLKESGFFFGMKDDQGNSKWCDPNCKITVTSQDRIAYSQHYDVYSQDRIAYSQDYYAYSQDRIAYTQHSSAYSQYYYAYSQHSSDSGQHYYV